jgi:shikimate kinase
MAWVVVTGYMGAGKSAVGRALAGRLGREFIDSDERIEHAAGMDIPKIFASKGELWFRRTEERTIRGIVQSEPGGVLSIGGGALESPRTGELVHRVACVAWLRADPERLWERVTGSTRPLATDRDRFLRRYARRAAAYAAAAHVTVDADQPFDAVLEELETAVRARLGRGLRAGS